MVIAMTTPATDRLVYHSDINFLLKHTIAAPARNRHMREEKVGDGVIDIQNIKMTVFERLEDGLSFEQLA